MASYREMDYPYEVDERALVTNARVAFIRSTYAHLAGAILAFIVLEFVLLQAVGDGRVVFQMLGNSPYSWLFVLVAFMGASWIAQMWARSETSVAMQYAGLALYIVAEAVIFLPLLVIATKFVKDPTLIPTAGILTLMVFGGLTISVFATGKDYSSLAPILSVGSMIALGVIIAGICFGFSLGLFFSFAMVALLSGYILFETSNVMLHHRTDMPVAAALMLFSSVATLFWYILRILIILSSNRD
jgi:FtsH-binding integral membrane protein